MNGSEPNPNEQPEEYGAEHFEDPLQQEIKTPWYKKLLRQKKLLIIGGIVLVAVIIALIIIFAGGRGDFSGSRVFLQLDGSDSVRSGAEVTYRISAINKEEVALHDVEIELIFPSGFDFKSASLDKESGRNIWKLGKIDKMSTGDFSVTGTLVGSAEELKIIKGVMRFKPSGIGSEFSVEGETSTIIAPGDVILTIDAPQAVASGNDIEYLVRYENRGTEVAKDLYIRLTYPDGFTFLQAESAASEGNALWKLPDLATGASDEIRIKGRLVGANNEAKRVVAELGTIDSAGNFVRQLSREDSTKVVESALLIMQTPIGKNEDIVNPGETLKILLEYENQGSVGLRNVFITTSFSNPNLIDFSKFDSAKGAYSDGKITWNSTGVPELALIQPGGSGSIEFQFKIKDRLEMPIESAADRNFTMVLKTELASEDIPASLSVDRKVVSEPLDFKVNSFIAVSTLGLYYEPFSGEPIGSGPMPPRVNQKTTYRIIWEVSNLANDLENAVVVAVLAPGVSFEDNSNVTHGQDLKYDSGSGKVTWNIGRVPANAGTFADKIAATFDISIRPGEDKVGQVVPLLQQTNFSARDTFTEKNLQGTAEPVTSELPGDPFAKGKGNVVP